jgi:protein associated with RNAse G/E
MTMYFEDEENAIKYIEYLLTQDHLGLDKEKLLEIKEFLQDYRDWLERALEP